ncbi:hypothetical protein CEXT_77121 [Caerostris extrusa]|uniref:Uncharacterized protein n=1 Tax=Caerostris extrusa TaxID=172846 RepID=A0AAV4MTF7_CAEEX|nr:hypothetical protein CEXT_77121 [Caerostris extrusa]
MPSRDSGINHNHDELIRQSAYSTGFPKHPSPACVAWASDWTARQVNRAMGYSGEKGIPASERCRRYCTTVARSEFDRRLPFVSLRFGLSIKGLL